jgi:hypothetical protein
MDQDIPIRLANAAAADETGAAMRLEQLRFERATIDFESARMAAIFQEAAE